MKKFYKIKLLNKNNILDTTKYAPVRETMKKHYYKNGVILEKKN